LKENEEIIITAQASNDIGDGDSSVPDKNKV